MTSGNEAAESVVRFARRWGCEVKGIEPGHAEVLHPIGNYWGRTIAAGAASQNPALNNPVYGPMDQKFPSVEYGDLEALEVALQQNPNICAYFMEPLLGEGGVYVPPAGYFKGVRELCDKYNVLWICDEVQMGLGRTGTFWGHRCEGVKADMMIAAKSLSGGFLPVSAVFGSDKVMNLNGIGSHGGTFGGFPLGVNVVKRAVEVALEENLAENAKEKGTYIIDNLKEMTKDCKFVKEVRGKGLAFGVELDMEQLPKMTSLDFCGIMKDNGLLVKDAKGCIIKCTPTLILNWSQTNKIVECFEKSLNTLYT